MTCPSCGASMRASGLGYVCDYCETVVVPEKSADGVLTLDDAAGEECPVCREGLKDALRCGVRVLYCTRCRGTLVAMAAYPALLEALRVEQGGAIVAPSSENRDLERRIACPKCHRCMETHYYAGPGHVVMDSCENCNVNWLDAGEVERIAHAMSSYAGVVTTK